MGVILEYALLDGCDVSHGRPRQIPPNILAARTAYFVSYIMLLRTLLFVFCLQALALSFQPQSLQAQAYNPYAPVMEDPPIGKDGKINWPAYYRSSAMEQKFQGYFEQGSCVGTNKRINAQLAANKVDTNALPRITVDMQVVRVTAGSLSAVNSQGAKMELVVHPKGVSKIEVTGDIQVQQVVPGMIARFKGAVDDTAKGTKEISALEITSLSPDLKPIAVEADREQTILGKVIKHSHRQFVVNVGTGKLKQLTFMLPEKTPVAVDGKTLDLVGIGDTAHAEGLVYTGEKGEQVLFTEKLVVRKLASKEVERPSSKEVSAN